MELSSVNYSLPQALPLTFSFAVKEEIHEIIFGVSRLQISPPEHHKRTKGFKPGFPGTLSPIKKTPRTEKLTRHSRKRLELLVQHASAAAAGKKSVSWTGHVSYRKTYSDGQITETTFQMVDESWKGGCKTKAELTAQEANSALDASENAIRLWKQQPYCLRPRGRNPLYKRENPWLSSKALCQLAESIGISKQVSP